MEKLKKGMMTIVAVAILIIPIVSIAGDLKPPGPPGPTMHTLDEIYNKLDQLRNPAPVGKTSQTLSYGTGDDGDWDKGAAWPNPRFTDNGNGTVTDNLTGLIWLKNADCFGSRGWAQALVDCNNLGSGSCGLSDGSSAGDWRLPNVKELQSLIYYGIYSPALPNTVGTGKWSNGDPFTDVQSLYYWSSTTYAGNTSSAWYVHMYYGYVYIGNKDYSYYVWPVRGGN
jgi:hypothetical protein